MPDRPTEATDRRLGVSVVVASRDRRDRLLESLDHLTASEADEIILVDNGSTDGTVAAVRSTFPGVRTLALPLNRGSAARTVGVRAAANPVVAFADDDSWWAAGALHRAVEHIRRHPRLGLVAGRVLVGDDGRLDPVSAAMERSPLPCPDGLPGRAVLGFMACGSVVRRSAYLATGGFNATLFFLGEERLLALDLAARGWHLAYAPDVVAHHHPRPLGPDGPDPGRRALALRNDLLTMWMRRPAARALRETAALAPRAARDPVARGALAGVLRRLPRALADRRPVPPDIERAMCLVEAADPPGRWR